MPVLTCRRVHFYAHGDEIAFHGWIATIKAVRRFEGFGDSMLLHVPSRLSNAALREFLALFQRYRIEMSQLAQFESKANRHWFTDPQKYWHKRVFRTTAVA
jgi:hypothetical protein